LKTIAIGIVGAGAWGINHVRVFAAEPSCRVTWICDPDPATWDRARQLAPSARLTALTSDLFTDPALDAVVIATPSSTHAALACQALEANKHVLVEKPLALSVADADRVSAAARRADRVVLVGHLMLYHPALVQLRHLIDAGELGKLHYLHAARRNLGRVRTDENVLWSLGPHDLSMLDYLLGEQPLAVSAQGQAFLQPSIEDVVFITLKLSSTIAHIHLSWLDPRKERRLTVVGSSKMAELDDVSAEKLRIFDRGYDRPPEFTQYGEYLSIRHGDVHIPHLTMAEPLRLMARDFLACCAANTTPRADLASGLRIVRILAAAERSLREHGAPIAP
jgi:predicted dehydrogenase